MFVPQNPPGPVLKGPASLRAESCSGFSVPFIYSSARTALLAALKGRGGQTIWLPAFMCRSLLKPIRACGLKVRYYDIDMDFMPLLNHVVPEAGDYLLVVHFFGIYRPLDGIREFCTTNRMLLIEDCAHILPDPKAPCPAGSTGDVAIFSLRKLLPVPDGGVLVERGEHKAETPPRNSYRHLGLKKRLLMLSETLAFKTGFNILPVKRAFRRALGNTDSAALSGERDPGAYHPDIHPMPENDFIGKTVERRKENYRSLHELLIHQGGVKIPFPVLPPGSCPQAFPVVVRHPAEVASHLNREGVEAGIWPGEEKIPFPTEDYPLAALWQKWLLLLPVHQELRLVHLEYMAKALRRAVDMTEE